MLVLFDRDCGFCAWMLAGLLRWDGARRRLRPAPIQGPEGERWLADLPDDVRLATWHAVDDHGHRSSGGRALTQVLAQLPGGRPLAAVAGRLPWLTDAAYRWVAEHRPLLSRPIPAGQKARARAGGAPRGTRRPIADRARRRLRRAPRHHVRGAARPMDVHAAASPTTSAMPRRPHLPAWFRLACRVRGPIISLGLALLVLGLAGLLLAAPGLGAGAWAGVCLAGFALTMVAIPLTFLPVGLRVGPPVVVDPPVRGRWIVVHSPAKRVPSHGTHALGQTWGLDLVCDPVDDPRPAFGTRGFRPPQDYPGFGRDVLAPADATVVAVCDGARDHRTRSSWPAFTFMVFEGMVRELFGARPMLGNHVVLDLGGGVYAALAHLQRGSVAVQPGDQVRRGQPLGRCGNSGNASEPHLHLQLMDRPRAFTAAGLPVAFRRAEGPPGVPSEEQALEVAL